VTESIQKELEKASAGNAPLPIWRTLMPVTVIRPRQGALIDALLRLSRAGRVDYQLVDVDVARTVQRIVEAMSVTIYERAATVEVHQLPPAYGDPTALEQVFANLIGNALNYLDSARPGRIEIGTLEAGDAELQGFNTYYVKDNGLGIPQAYHSKVFQALKRLHPEAAKGEGMGLAIVRRVVERHGGSVWFESAANEGSTFFVQLPCSRSNTHCKTSATAHERDCVV
jgi:light-regulated signal transduction histidine kinase (bacteriophytochrome)